MKAIKTIFAGVVLFVLVSVSAITGTCSKVIAVINKADCCQTCQKNGELAMTAFLATNKDMAVQFLANDVTNDETKLKSAEELKKVGLAKVIAAYPGAGVAYFFNSETKELINQVSVAKPDTELAAALITANKGLK